MREWWHILVLLGIDYVYDYCVMKTENESLK